MELSALSSLTGGAVLGFTGQEEKNPTAAASAIPRQGGVRGIISLLG